jgi:hypothetical protein
MTRKESYRAKMLALFVFGVAMAYFEAAVVVYLRGLFYPEGFSFPLKLIPRDILVVELFRELATIIMLATVGIISGKRFWERFGYFMFLFGVWDIFYYVWLKATIDWPSSLVEWDVLFLIPVPWIGPVIAPAAVAVTMSIMGMLITHLYSRGGSFRVTVPALILSVLGIGTIFLSFVWDTGASMRQQPPQPYLYGLLIAGLLVWIAAFGYAYYSSGKELQNLS